MTHAELVAEPAAMDSPTEKRLFASYDLDQLDALGVLRRINAADRTVPDAVAAVLPALAEVVDRAVEVMDGAGASTTSARAPPGDSACWIPQRYPRPTASRPASSSRIRPVATTR